MAEPTKETMTIGLKRPAGSSDKRPDIELTEEDLKQIAGGTTKGVTLRPGGGGTFGVS
jgi:hypothetical protein